MLVKIYGNDAEAETRDSPAECMGCQSGAITGRPDPAHISTSYVERQNLTIRIGMGRFTRLTNAFSKKLKNDYWAIALHYMHYNFFRIHKTLRVTPARRLASQTMFGRFRTLRRFWSQNESLPSRFGP